MELHTEIPDLTSDVGRAGVPFFDYKTYTFKLLFPSNKFDHPILQMATKKVRINYYLIINYWYLMVIAIDGLLIII